MYYKYFSKTYINMQKKCLTPTIDSVGLTGVTDNVALVKGGDALLIFMDKAHAVTNFPSQHFCLNIHTYICKYI